MVTFGEAVRAARLARGWTQRELAVRAGVSQRAISSWESGVSEPGDETKRVVDAVLHLPSGVGPARTASRVRSSGRPLLSELPFEELDPGDFEDFAVSLAVRLFPGADVYRLGKSGHTQYGFDVAVERDGTVVAGIQCKRVREFGPKEVGKAVAAAAMKVDTAFIFLSRAASPDARAELRVHRGWQLWDKGKLSHAVHDLPLDQAVPLVDRYFPLLREEFLGVPLPGPWLEPGRYFSSTGRSERASHRWPLAGRAETLEELAEFAASSSGRAGLLVGRGGTGKTKLLHDLCQRLPRETSVRFLERDPDIDERAFERLPAGPLLVVIDDAHDEAAPVGKVVRGVLDANQEAGVLLALRPDGEAWSRRQLREAGLDPEQAPRWELGDLELPDAETLARAVLGPHQGYAAPRLAAATRDCPFLLVTGAILIRDGAVELSRIEGDDRIRRELTETLADAISAGASDRPEFRQEVLRAVAAFQPLRTKDKDFRDTIEGLTGRAFDQVLPHLSAWEDSGILLRRGDTYRVVPDLLGDALLARAATAPETGTPTEYLDRARRASGGQAMANLLVNASRVDWQEPPARRGELVNSLWRAVTGQFRSTDTASRIALLEVLAKVAFYQPRQTLKLVRWALENPSEPTEVDAGFGYMYTYTEQEVRDAAARVLRVAAYDPDVLAEAAELLWEIGRSDTRPANQHPDHALRKLADIARFDRRGVTVYQQALPGIVERWLRRPARQTDAHDPLTVLHPLLAAEDHQEIWSRHALTFRPFLIDPDSPAVAELRGRVLDLAFGQIDSADQRRAVAAARTIGTSLAGPLGGFGLEVTREIHKRWAPHFQRTLARLRDKILRQPPGPLVAVALRQELQWAAEHPASAIHQASLNVLTALPRRREYELARALHGGPIDPPPDADAYADYLDRQRANDQFMHDCAETVRDWPEPEVIATAERLLGDLHAILGDDEARARPFVWELVTDRPHLGVAICAQVRDRPGSPLSSLISVTLSALAQASDPRAVSIAWQLLGTCDTDLARQVAHAFGLQRGRTDIREEEPALLRALVAHPDPDGIVPAAAAGAVRYLGAEHRDLAVDLLTREPGRWGSATLNEFALAFGPHGKLEWNDLAQRHKDTFIGALRSAASIESFLITTFLSKLSLQEPYSVIDLLTARVERAETGASLGSYVPLPHHWPTGLQFRQRDDFPDILRRVREWLTSAPESAMRQYFGARLFAIVAGPFDAQTRQMIDEYLIEPDPAKMTTVSTILRGAPRELVWDLSLVSACLRAADACGPQSLSAVQSALHSATFSGGRSADIGQPFPEDVEQRDTAAKLAERAVRGGLEEEFYRALSQSAEHWINLSLSDSDISGDGREW